MKNNRAVVYHYWENDDADRDNLLWFLALGWRADIDFYIGLTDTKNIDLPQADNVFYFHRSNHNYDFGGHADIVNHHLDWRSYEKIVFMYSKIRGPITPSYVDDWFSAFTRKLEGDVGIVGSVINILNDRGQEGKLYKQTHGGKAPFSHVQSTVFALDARSMEILDKSDFWNNSKTYSKMDTIIHFEIRMSQLLLENSLNLRCLLPPYNDIDYRTDVRDINQFSANGDPRYKNCYFGRTIDPYQIMFLTMNRDIYDPTYVEHLCLEQLDQITDDTITKQYNMSKWVVNKYLKNSYLIS